MSEWKTISLGTVGKISMCKRVLKAETSEAGDIPFFKISTFGGTADSYISSELFWKYKSKYPFPKKGDILISAAGTLGKTVIYDGTPAYFQDSNIVWVDNDEKIILNIFLYYFFQTKPWQTTSGSTINRIYNEDLRAIRVIHPSVALQQKIAAVLSALDAKIELNQRMSEELEGMAKLLYDYWFVQYDFPMSAAQAAALGKPHLTGQPYRASGGPMTYNETLKREIPEGWEVKPLFDAMAVQYGFPFSTTQFTEEPTGIPVVRIRDIVANSISVYTTEKADSRYELLPNDLVIGMDGNFHMNFWDKAGCYLNQRSVRIRARAESSISTFQAYFEMSPYIKAREKNVSRTTVGHLSDKDLKRLHLLEAPNSDQFQPRTTIDSMLTKIVHCRTETQELTTLRDWLLPMLMNGQVVVSEHY